MKEITRFKVGYSTGIVIHQCDDGTIWLQGHDIDDGGYWRHESGIEIPACAARKVALILNQVPLTKKTFPVWVSRDPEDRSLTVSAEGPGVAEWLELVGGCLDQPWELDVGGDIATAYFVCEQDAWALMARLTQDGFEVKSPDKPI